MVHTPPNGRSLRRFLRKFSPSLVTVLIVDRDHGMRTSTGVQDMATLSHRGPVSTVHLRLAFARGLHPFYPPSLEVRRFQCMHQHILCPGLLCAT